MNNILLFEFDVDGRFLSVYCGETDNSFFGYAFYDGKSAHYKFERNECRFNRHDFLAAGNIFTPNKLKFSLYGEMGISCDINIKTKISGKSNRNITNFLPRNARVEFISILSEFFGEVNINGNTHHIKSLGYVHKLISKKLPDKFFVINGLGDNVVVASYMSNNAVFKYNFDSFVTDANFNGVSYRFADFNLSSISASDDGKFIIMCQKKGNLELYLRVDCGNEKLITINDKIIRANNYTRVEVILLMNGKQLFKQNIAASFLICGKLKIGEVNEVGSLCEARI